MIIRLHPNIAKRGGHESDGWLGNDDANLVDGLLSEEGDGSVPPISSSKIEPIEVDVLELRSHPEPALRVQGSWMPLSDAQTIQCQGIEYTCELLPETAKKPVSPEPVEEAPPAASSLDPFSMQKSVVPPSSALMGEDIWDTQPASQQTRFADPFQTTQQTKRTMPAPTAQPAAPNYGSTMPSTGGFSGDNLDFLYGASSSPTQHDPNALLPGGSNYQNDFSSLAGPSDFTTSAPAHSNYLDHTDSNDQRRYLAGQDRVQDPLQGDILADLGINGENKSIIDKPYDDAKPSYAEQAPIDMLDEFWQDEGAYPSYSSSEDTYAAPDNTYYHPPYPQPPAEEKSVFKGLKKFLKKSKQETY